MTDIVATLRGAAVTGISFGVTYFDLRLRTGDDQDFLLSAAADVSFGASDEDAVDFRTSGNCGALITLIEARLVDIEIDDGARSGALSFDNGERVHVAWPDKLYDNLFIVRRELSDEWWVIG